MVLSSCNWLTQAGLAVDPVTGERTCRQLNDDYWPVSHANVRACADVESLAPISTQTEHDPLAEP